MRNKNSYSQKKKKMIFLENMLWICSNLENEVIYFLDFLVFCQQDTFL